MQKEENLTQQVDVSYMNSKKVIKLAKCPNEDCLRAFYVKTDKMKNIRMMCPFCRQEGKMIIRQDIRVKLIEKIIRKHNRLLKETDYGTDTIHHEMKIYCKKLKEECLDERYIMVERC